MWPFFFSSPRSPLFLNISSSSGTVNGPRCEHWIQNSSLPNHQFSPHQSLYTDPKSGAESRTYTMDTYYTWCRRKRVGKKEKKNFKISPATVRDGGRAWGGVCFYTVKIDRTEHNLSSTPLLVRQSWKKKRTPSSFLRPFLIYPLFPSPPLPIRTLRSLRFSRKTRIPNAITFFFSFVFIVIVLVVEWHVDFKTRITHRKIVKLRWDI